MNIDLSALDGNKTYISIVLYVFYLIAVKHGYMAANPDIDTLLKGAIGASFAHKVSKLSDTPTPPAK